MPTAIDADCRGPLQRPDETDAPQPWGQALGHRRDRRRVLRNAQTDAAPVCRPARLRVAAGAHGRHRHRSLWPDRRRSAGTRPTMPASSTWSGTGWSRWRSAWPTRPGPTLSRTASSSGLIGRTRPASSRSGWARTAPRSTPATTRACRFTAPGRCSTPCRPPMRRSGPAPSPWDHRQSRRQCPRYCRRRASRRWLCWPPQAPTLPATLHAMGVDAQRTPAPSNSQRFIVVDGAHPPPR